jgi:hypothetical protein
MGNLLFFKNKTQLATAIAILFHSIGFFGIFYFHKFLKYLYCFGTLCKTSDLAQKLENIFQMNAKHL